MAPSHEASQAAVHTHQHIVQDRHVAEQADGLKGTANAQAGNTVRAPAGNVTASEDHLATRRPIQSRDHVKEVVLPSRWGQSGRRPCPLEAEVETVEGSQAAEALRSASFQGATTYAVLAGVRSAAVC